MRYHHQFMWNIHLSRIRHNCLHQLIHRILSSIIACDCYVLWAAQMWAKLHLCYSIADIWLKRLPIFAPQLISLKQLWKSRNRPQMFSALKFWRRSNARRWTWASTWEFLNAPKSPPNSFIWHIDHQASYPIHNNKLKSSQFTQE